MTNRVIIALWSAAYVTWHKHTRVYCIEKRARIFFVENIITNDAVFCLHGHALLGTLEGATTLESMSINSA
jgi:hypothetical protein